MGRHDAIDVPDAGEGEAFKGELPTLAAGSRTQPGWMALSDLASRNERIRCASGAAKAGAFVRTMRLAAGLSQDQVAVASGMTQSVVSDIERGAGKIGPSFETLLRLAEACGMDIGFAPAGVGAVSASAAETEHKADTVMSVALDRVDNLVEWGHLIIHPSASVSRRDWFDPSKGFGFARPVTGAGSSAKSARAGPAVVVGKAMLGRTVVEVSSDGLLRVHEGGGRDVVYAPISVQMPEAK